MKVFSSAICSLAKSVFLKLKNFKKKYSMLYYFVVIFIGILRDYFINKLF